MPRKWQEARKNIKSISDSEKSEIKRQAEEYVRSCRVCGCTDDHACPGGCYWVEEDLCSACAGNVIDL